MRGKARVKVKLNGKNVLAAAMKGKATTGVLPPSGKAKLLVKTKGKKGSRAGRMKTVVTATSTAYPAKSDRGAATVRL